MDAGFALGSINWLAVVLAAISAFAVGGLWYGPVLGRTWMRLTGVSEDEVREANMIRTFGVAFVLDLLAAATLALFVGADAGAASGALAGFMAGAFLVGTAIGVIYVFERRPVALWAIDAGYQVVAFTLMGLIVGAW
jgi:hypothetical protein